MKVVGLISAACVALMLSGCGGGDGGGSATTAGTQSAPSAPSAPGKVVLAYAVNTTASLTSAMSNTTPVNAVSIDVLQVSASGSLTGTLPTNILASNQAAGKASYACIIVAHGSSGIDPDIAHAALVTNRSATLQNIVALARTQSLTGINLDFEGLYPADRAAYSSFVAELASQLHQIPARLVVSVPPKLTDSTTNTWAWPYDYAALGQSVDFLQVMTYDQHYSRSAPGPVASISWMQSALQYATSVVPAGKILLGLPAYGYDWNQTTNTGVSVSFKDMPAMLSATKAVAQWDAATLSAHINYVASDGSAHVVWYETSQGIQAKAHLANTLSLAGVSVWVLGSEDSSFWAGVSAGLQ
ncbi:hypothetical protein JYK21_22315 [Ralstonia pickettii]|nr:hypothetical protein [Ralstonia pickettii]